MAEEQQPMEIVDNRPVLFETMNRFDTIEEAHEFFAAITNVNHRCIGIVKPVREIVTHDEDGEVEEVSYVVPIYTHGPSIADCERDLLVDNSATKMRYRSNLVHPVQGKDVRISPEYRNFIGDMISLFLNLEQTRILVGAEIRNVRLSSPSSGEDSFMRKQIVCTEFKLAPPTSRTRVKKNWGTLHSIIRNINARFDITCSSLEMDELLRVIKSGVVSPGIFRLPIFLTTTEKTVFMNNLWGDMAANKAGIFYDPSFEPSISQFRGLAGKYTYLADMVIKEKQDSDIRKKKKQKRKNQTNQGSGKAGHQGGQGSGKGGHKAKKAKRTDPNELNLFGVVDSLRNCDEHFERMRKEMPTAARNFPLKNLEDFHFLLECALPNLFHPLVTRHPGYLPPKTAYPE